MQQYDTAKVPNHWFLPSAGIPTLHPNMQKKHVGPWKILPLESPAFGQLGEHPSWCVRVAVAKVVGALLIRRLESVHRWSTGCNMGTHVIKFH